MRTIVWCALTVLMFAADVGAADFGTRGGPEPANVDEIVNVLRQDPYDMELLISYGTSKGGSAGHLALAIRDAAGQTRQTNFLMLRLQWTGGLLDFIRTKSSTGWPNWNAAMASMFGTIRPGQIARGFRLPRVAPRLLVQF